MNTVINHNLSKIRKTVTVSPIIVDSSPIVALPPYDTIDCGDNSGDYRGNKGNLKLYDKTLAAVLVCLQ